MNNAISRIIWKIEILRDLSHFLHGKRNALKISPADAEKA